MDAHSFQGTLALELIEEMETTGVSEEHEKASVFEKEKEMDGRSCGKPPCFARPSTTRQKPLGH